MVDITESKGPVSEDAIASLEKSLAIQLPPPYRSFLLKYNGGRPNPDCFNFYEKKTGSMVDWFLGIHADRYTGLNKLLATYANRIPENFFPVAIDPGDNLVCLSVKGNDFGKVYFWDHEQEADGAPPDYRNVTLIANSFDEFVEGLYELTIV